MFIKDMCVTGDPQKFRVKAKHLQDAYSEWCTVNMEKPLRVKEFAQQLEERGFERRRMNDGWNYFGIGLWTPDGPTESEPSEPKMGLNRASEKLYRETPKMVHSGFTRFTLLTI
jgi:hypothetical protein